MAGVQQIIDWLDCMTTHQHKCLSCPFNPHPGIMWPYGCIRGQNDILDAAREILRKYQEVVSNDQ